MNLEFIKISVKNFRSYGNQATSYEFYNGLDLITGINGNGKTSLLLHGIYFALYGIGVNDENVDTLINDTNRKNMEVELELISNNVKYKIIRGRKPNILKIFRGEDEELIPSIDSKTDDLFIIDNILHGINKNTFLKLFAIQANNTDISIFRMNAKDRRALLESLFDLSVYNEIKSKNDENESLLAIDRLALEKENENIEKQIELIENNIKTYDNLINNLKERVINDNKLSEQKSKEIIEFETKTKKEIEELEKEISNLELDVKKINSNQIFFEKKNIEKNIMDLNKKIKDISIYTENIKTNISLYKDVKKLIDDNKKEIIDIKELDSKRKLVIEFKDKIKLGQSEIVKIDSQFESQDKFLLTVGECANNNQEFLDCVKKKFGNSDFSKDEWINNMKPSLLNDIKNKEEEIVKIETFIKNQELSINSLKSNEDNIKKYESNIELNLKQLIEVANIDEKIGISNFLDISNSKIKIIENDIVLGNKRVDEINKELEQFKILTNDIKSKETILKDKNKLNSDNLNKDLENIKNSIEKSNKELKDANDNIAKSNKELLDKNKIIIENNKKLVKIEEDLKIKSEIKSFLKDEKIKYFIIKQSFPILKESFNKILKRLFYGQIRVEIDNKFEVKVYKNGIEQNFKNFSEGEKKRLDLAFIFTVHEFLSIKNQMNVNILIMDELLDSALDSVGTDVVIDYLNEMKLNRDVILITHRDENIEHDRRFVISKEERYSTIKELSYDK